MGCTFVASIFLAQGSAFATALTITFQGGALKSIPTIPSDLLCEGTFGNEVCMLEHVTLNINGRPVATRGSAVVLTATSSFI